MLSKIKYLLPEYRFYFFSITSLLALLVYNHSETLALEKELIRIEKELHENQIIHKRRQKAFGEKAERQRVEVERILNEIKSQK
ncbi:hypothetical protein [Flavobacterium aquicola]|uniref:Uncharacterized protein n=1 Tax=Flavobacterium aquicola TaxID=1682742 RepID=A0A3E0ERX3_9FLAO|nr:hypothetical protein [Flavobacterium aquicola]REH00978.1 hypothetical protein C8P67_102231 [Flavobacterium aquicola]